MKRAVPLGVVVGVQAAGSLATLASVVLVARLRGVEVQGIFGLLKAEIDLLVALLLFGMPQAIFYFLHRGSLSWGAVRRMTAYHALSALVVAFVVVAYRHGLGPAEFGVVGAVSVAVAAAALVAHGNFRGALLESRSSLVFSLVTALPGAFLLLVVATVLPAGGMEGRGAGAIAPVLAFAYLVTWLVTVLIARPSWLATGTASRSPGIAVLGKYGVATWVPAVAQNLTPVIALSWIDQRIGDPVGLGIFSAAVMALNLVLTPLGMLLPLLFKRWVGTDEVGRWNELRRALWPMMALCLGFAGIVLLLETPGVSFVFGPDYLSRGSVFALLALGLWPQTASRLFGVWFNADGRPWLAIVPEVARVAAFSIGLVVFQAGAVLTVAGIWVAAEFVLPAVGWVLVRRSTRHTARKAA